MLPKRTVAEILFIAEVEKTLADIYCEGPLDARVMAEHAKYIKRNCLTYAAEQVEWPGEANRPGGYKGKIIYLSEILSAKKLRGFCVVDRDLDTVENRSPTNANLFSTDYACMEMYGLDESDLQAYLGMCFNLTVSSKEIQAIFLATKTLFAIRFLREKHCLGASLPDATEIISGDFKSVQIETAKYLDRCRQVNGYDKRWDEVIKNLDAQIQSMTGDYREYINIHDLSAIFAKIVRSSKSKTISMDPFFLEKHCAYLITSQEKFDFPLFHTLAEN